MVDVFNIREFFIKDFFCIAISKLKHSEFMDMIKSILKVLIKVGGLTTQRDIKIKWQFISCTNKGRKFMVKATQEAIYIQRVVVRVPKLAVFSIITTP